MDRITTPSRIRDLFGPGKDGFGDGVPSIGGSSTQLEAAWFNNEQEEICNVIELSGLPLDPADRTQLWQAIARITRRRLLADVEYFVSPTGDDATGDGSAAAPWATLRYCWDWILGHIDLAGWRVTVTLTPGLHGGADLGGAIPGQIYPIVVRGDPLNPGNVRILEDPNRPFYNIWVSEGASVYIDGVQFDGGLQQLVVTGGRLECHNCNFSTCTIHISAGGNGQFYIGDNNHIIGPASTYSLNIATGAYAHFAGASLILDTAALAGAPNAIFLYVTTGGSAALSADFDFVGPGVALTTGYRYLADMNGIIADDHPAGPQRLPGNIPGEPQRGGQDGSPRPLGDPDPLISPPPPPEPRLPMWRR
jgi:hypothetical protein